MSYPLNVILASRSPRRTYLLHQMGIEHEVVSPISDESYDSRLRSDEIVEQLALRKAMSIPMPEQPSLIIGADTIVVVDSMVLGKPTDVQDALDMIRRLQGSDHEVYTGLAVVEGHTGRYQVGHKRVMVRMRSLSDDEMMQYVATKEPFDKAGGYSIQGIGAAFIEMIHGDYYAVMGLPLELMTIFLRNFGYDIFATNGSDYLAQ